MKDGGQVPLQARAWEALPRMTPISAGACILQTASGLVVATQEQGVYVSGTRVCVRVKNAQVLGPTNSAHMEESPEINLTGPASQGQILRTVPTPSHTHPCSDTQKFAQAVVSLSTLFVLVPFYPPSLLLCAGICQETCPSPALAQRLSPKMPPKSERLDLWEQLQDQRNQLKGHCPVPANRPAIWKKFTRCPF